MNDQLFIIGDGDDIRKKIESYLLDQRFDELTEYSASLLNTIEILKELASSEMKSRIIYAGGDDICFITTISLYQEQYLRQIMTSFKENTGSTISFGVGSSVEEAFINLRKAKAGGKGGLVVPESLQRLSDPQHLTKARRRRPTASAPTSLPLSGAPEA